MNKYLLLLPFSITLHSASAQFMSEEVIGNTYYELQSNDSPYNSIFTDIDGTISTVWTFSPDTIQTPSIYPNRGTGYNYFNLTNWANLPTQRIEPVRTGFPNIGITGSGKEVVISHKGTGLYMSSRTPKGTGTWTSVNLPFSINIYHTWSRMVIGGSQNQSIHLIYANDFLSGDVISLFYAKSDDEGNSWPVSNLVLPGIDTSFYNGFGGDNYAIDAVGNVIAIALGSTFTDVILLKSLDNGNTWTKNIVDTFPIPHFDLNTMITDTNNDGIVDTINGYKGQLDVAIDPIDSSVHIVYNNFRFYADGSTPGSFNYFPGSDTIYYWNDRDFNLRYPEQAAVPVDFNNNGILDVNNFYSQPAMSKPAIAIYDGIPFIFYLSADEKTTLNGYDTQSHLYYTYKQANQWIPPQVDPFMNLPMGWTYNNTSVKYVSVSNPLGSSCKIDYEYLRDTIKPSFPRFQNAEIIHGSIDACAIINSIQGNNSSDYFTFFPNPASNQLNIQTQSEGSIELYSSSGQKLKSIIVNTNDRIIMSVADLAKGIYYLRFQNNQSNTGKILVIE